MKKSKRVKNYGTNNEVMKAFVNGEKYPHANFQRNVFFEDNVLYSYGHHFPIAIRLQDNSFLVNGDRYSATTSKHQWTIQNELRNTIGGVKKRFVTSWGAVNRAGGNVDGSNIKLLDSENDLSIWDEDTEKWIKNNPYDLMGITKQYRKNRDTGKQELYHIHRPGATLLKIDNSYWICGMDEGSYFVSRLPRPCISVKRAFEILKPLEVRKEQVKDINIPRQGEWFFIPQEMPKREARKMYFSMDQKISLPRENDRSNFHIATRAKIKGKTIFVSGQIKHTEHRQLKLSTLKDIKIFKVIKNTATANFSSEGRVD